MSNGTIHHNGLCLYAVGGGTKNGTKLDLWTCINGTVVCTATYAG